MSLTTRTRCALCSEGWCEWGYLSALSLIVQVQRDRKSKSGVLKGRHAGRHALYIWPGSMRTNSSQHSSLYSPLLILIISPIPQISLGFLTSGRLDVQFRISSQAKNLLERQKGQAQLLWPLRLSCYPVHIRVQKAEIVLHENSFIHFLFFYHLFFSLLHSHSLSRRHTRPMSARILNCKTPIEFLSFMNIGRSVFDQPGAQLVNHRK